jgi:hypothetical protein
MEVMTGSGSRGSVPGRSRPGEGAVMCAPECPEFFAEMRDWDHANGWDTYEVRVVRRPDPAELDDDQRPLTPLEVMAGPARVRGVYLPRIQKRARHWLAREGWRLTGDWDWDGDDFLYWADVAPKEAWARLAWRAAAQAIGVRTGRQHTHRAGSGDDGG